MLREFYKHRFGFFLVVQLAILFGSLLFPLDFFENTILPLLFLFSIASGILMISKRKKLMWSVVILFVVAVSVFGTNLLSKNPPTGNTLLQLTIHFVFYIIITLNMVEQVIHAPRVTKKVIMGLMSGYISMGFLAFFLFMIIELTHPGAFQGVLIENGSCGLRADAIMYYAYITLLTIGYGEIVPAIPIAQKAAILVGLTGQFYIVIITAVVIEKYIKHSSKN